MVDHPAEKRIRIEVSYTPMPPTPAEMAAQEAASKVDDPHKKFQTFVITNMKYHIKAAGGTEEDLAVVDHLYFMSGVFSMMFCNDANSIRMMTTETLRLSGAIPSNIAGIKVEVTTFDYPTAIVKRMVAGAGGDEASVEQLRDAKGVWNIIPSEDGSRILVLVDTGVYRKEDIPAAIAGIKVEVVDHNAVPTEARGPKMHYGW